MRANRLTDLMDTGSFEVPGTAFSDLSENLTLQVVRTKYDMVPNEATTLVRVVAVQYGIKLEP